MVVTKARGIRLAFVSSFFPLPDVIRLFEALPLAEVLICLNRDELGAADFAIFCDTHDVEISR